MFTEVEVLYNGFLLFTKCSQNFSTQCLTWLIIGVILQLEQRRGHKEIRKRVPNQSSEKSFQHSRKKDASDLLKTVKEFERSNDL